MWQVGPGPLLPSAGRLLSYVTSSLVRPRTFPRVSPAWGTLGGIGGAGAPGREAQRSWLQPWLPVPPADSKAKGQWQNPGRSANVRTVLTLGAGLFPSSARRRAGGSQQSCR